MNRDYVLYDWGICRRIQVMKNIDERRRIYERKTFKSDWLNSALIGGHTKGEKASSISTLRSTKTGNWLIFEFSTIELQIEVDRI